MRRLPALVALALLGFALHARAEDEIVVLKDGTRLRGTVSSASSALLVRTGLRDVFVSPALVARRDKAPADAEAAPEYLFHADEAKTKKKGTLALVVDKFQWGGPFTPDGRCSMSCVDPKLGAISFNLIVTRATPALVTIEGVEYTYKLTYPSASMGALVPGLVQSQVDAADAASLKKAIAFFRQYGDFDTAVRWTDALEKAAPADPALAAERTRIESARFLAALDEIRRLQLVGDVQAAHERAGKTTATPALEKALPDETKDFHERTAALTKQVETRERMTKLLTDRKIDLPPLTVPQAARLAAIADALGADKVADAWLPALRDEWAEAIPRSPCTAAQVGDAVALAAEVAGFFHTNKSAGAHELTQKLEKAAIPDAWKAAIFRLSAKYDDPQERGWHKVEYEHPVLRSKFHYYVQVPSGYRPDVAWPALISLHGQHGTAETVNGWWGPFAETYGMILISPEYIYGRKDGYGFSETEHQSVLGALRDALAAYAIDTDRVYLEGQSQGGHATWDMGSANADRFAGVMPVIGASLSVKKLENYLDTSLYCVDGSDDGGAPTLNRASIQELARLKADARYVEYVGRKHEAFSEEYDAACRWMLAHRRPAGRTEAHLNVHIHGGARRAFVEITGFLRAPPAENIEQAFVAEVTARIDSAANRIEATAKGATNLRFYPSPPAIDFSRPMTITVNGKEAFKGPVKVDWDKAIEDALARRDRRDWTPAQVSVPVR